MKLGIKVRDLGWSKILKTVRASVGGTVLDVGVLADGQPRTGGEISNPEIALIHEFGSPAAGIPERSFLRSTVNANRQKYSAEIRRIATKILDGVEAEAAVNLLGMRVAGDVKRTIQAGIDPPLALETVARKGSTKPLVDTGQLVNSIHWRTSDKGKHRG